MFSYNNQISINYFAIIHDSKLSYLMGTKIETDINECIIFGSSELYLLCGKTLSPLYGITANELISDGSIPSQIIKLPCWINKSHFFVSVISTHNLIFHHISPCRRWLLKKYFKYARWFLYGYVILDFVTVLCAVMMFSNIWYV